MKSILMIFTVFGFIISCGENKTQTADSIEEQFIKIEFKYDKINELNTFNKTFTKNLLIEGPMQIPFGFTKAQQEIIIAKMDAIDFFWLPNSLLNQETSFIIPDAQSIIKIEYGSIAHEVKWDGMPPKEFSKEHQRIVELANLIKSIVQQNPEYKKLPSGY